MSMKKSEETLKCFAAARFDIPACFFVLRGHISRPGCHGRMLRIYIIARNTGILPVLRAMKNKPYG